MIKLKSNSETESLPKLAIAMLTTLLALALYLVYGVKQKHSFVYQTISNTLFWNKGKRLVITLKLLIVITINSIFSVVLLPQDAFLNISLAIIVSTTILFCSLIFPFLLKNYIHSYDSLIFYKQLDVELFLAISFCLASSTVFHQLNLKLLSDGLSISAYLLLVVAVVFNLSRGMNRIAN